MPPSRRAGDRARTERPIDAAIAPTKKLRIVRPWPSNIPSLRRDSMRERRHRRRVPCAVAWAATIAYLLNPAALRAQAENRPLTLADAVQLALRNYPAVKERRARAQAAEEGIGLARTAYLPRLDMVWQENRATTNNVF